jgi:LAO/AO transport system kinase
MPTTTTSSDPPAPVNLALRTAGWGDEMQAAKAGLLEIADLFVVNKADRRGNGGPAHRHRAGQRPRRHPVAGAVAGDSNGPLG